jgi:hypothetical protein
LDLSRLLLRDVALFKGASPTCRRGAPLTGESPEESDNLPDHDGIAVSTNRLKFDE